MGDSFFNEGTENTGGYQPIYHGIPVESDKRRIEKTESKEGRVIFTGKDLTQKRRDRIAVYALVLSALSIFCIFFTNGYLVSMAGLLLSARALNIGTSRRKTVFAAVICSIMAILLYIMCVAARPVLQDMKWYLVFMDTVGKYWPL
ncbi:MAG: hypothetical protein K6E98_08880 [Lachnospiraceae bacterium]|nr:hypothetical protein [Lachnospiraceae bacterium]